MLQPTVCLCLKKTRVEKFYSVFLEQSMYRGCLYVPTHIVQSLDFLFSAEKLVTFFINEASGAD